MRKIFCNQSLTHNVLVRIKSNHIKCVKLLTQHSCQKWFDLHAISCQAVSQPFIIHYLDFFQKNCKARVILHSEENETETSKHLQNRAALPGET